MVLRNGGTLHIDDGRPTSALFHKTMRNIREVAPTLYFNVPRGYELLVPALRADNHLRERFFSQLKLVFYAAASLPRHLWDEMNAMSELTTGRVIPMVTSWGATETSPLATDCHFQSDQPGVIGLPIPGCTLKLVRQGSKLEARVAGPQVTPGYWRRSDLDGRHFDAEGYYCSGDAFCFANPDHAVEGLVFDGRLSEDFKLTTGTWVSVGSLRLRAVTALAPLAQDVAVTGHDRDEVGLLIFPNFSACAALCPDLGPHPSASQIVTHGALRREVERRLAEMRVAFPASSMHARRAILMPETASIDAGEITDKGYLNQRRTLELRNEYVVHLYGELGNPNIVRINSSN
jgi:feruloyl-CoA synthase